VTIIANYLNIISINKYDETSHENATTLRFLDRVLPSTWS